MDDAHRYPIRVDRKLGFIDRRGEEVIPPIHTSPPGARGLTGFYGGVAWVFVDGEYGLIDASGALLFRASFDVVCCFEANGRAKVFPSSKLGKGLCDYELKGCGLIDRSGGFVIPPKYDNLFDWYDRFIVAITRGRYGTIDLDGRTIIPPLYADIHGLRDEIDGRSEHRYIVAKDHAKKRSAILTPAGVRVTDFVFEEIGFDYADGLVRARRKRRDGFLNRAAEIAIEPSFASADPFSEGLARVQTKKNGYFGFIDTSGAVVIPAQFEAATAFREGLAAVKPPNQGYGYIDLRGDWVIPPGFDKADAFVDGVGRVSVGDQQGLIDRSGAYIIPLAARDLHRELKSALIRFCERGKIGFFDTTGAVAIPPEHKQADPPKHGLIHVKDGYIDFQGTYVWRQPARPLPTITFKRPMHVVEDYAKLAQRVRAKCPTRSFRPKSSEDAVRKIEAAYGIELPSDYRRFVLEVGDGGPGPLEGIHPLEAACKASHRLTEPFVPSVVVDDGSSDFWHKPGILLISDDSVVYTCGLVLTGPERGTIWFSECNYWFPYTDQFWEAVRAYDHDYDAASEHLTRIQRQIPRMSFYQWYCAWLAEED